MQLTQLQKAFQRSIASIPEQGLTRIDKIRIQHEVNCCGRVITNKELNQEVKIGLIRYMGADWNETAFIMGKFLSGVLE